MTSKLTIIIIQKALKRFQISNFKILIYTWLDGQTPNQERLSDWWRWWTENRWRRKGRTVGGGRGCYVLWCGGHHGFIVPFPLVSKVPLFWREIQKKWLNNRKMLIGRKGKKRITTKLCGFSCCIQCADTIVLDVP